MKETKGIYTYTYTLNHFVILVMERYGFGHFTRSESGWVCLRNESPTFWVHWNHNGVGLRNSTLIHCMKNGWQWIKRFSVGCSGSMSPAIAADVVSFKPSREVWKALLEVYDATSKARVNQLRGVLQNTKKGSMKMIEYLASHYEASVWKPKTCW